MCFRPHNAAMTTFVLVMSSPRLSRQHARRPFCPAGLHYIVWLLTNRPRLWFSSCLAVEPICEGGRPGHPNGLQHPELRRSIPSKQSQGSVAKEQETREIRRVGASARKNGNDEVSWVFRPDDDLLGLCRDLSRLTGQNQIGSAPARVPQRLFLFRPPLIVSRSIFRDTTFQSSAYGKRENVETSIDGRVMFDMLPYMFRNHKLSSYSLNSVSAELLGQQKEDVHHSIISDLQVCRLYKNCASRLREWSACFSPYSPMFHNSLLPVNICKQRRLCQLLRRLPLLWVHCSDHKCALLFFSCCAIFSTPSEWLRRRPSAVGGVLH